jgi:hypothetical protein
MKIIDILLQAYLRMAELCLRAVLQIGVAILSAALNILTAWLTKSRVSRKHPKGGGATRVRHPRNPNKPHRRKKQWPKTLH